MLFDELIMQTVGSSQAEINLSRCGVTAKDINMLPAVAYRTGDVLDEQIYHSLFPATFNVVLETDQPGNKWLRVNMVRIEKV